MLLLNHKKTLDYIYERRVVLNPCAQQRSKIFIRC